MFLIFLVAETLELSSPSVKKKKLFQGNWCDASCQKILIRTRIFVQILFSLSSYEAKCGKRNSAGKRVAPRFVRWTKFHHSSQPLERLNEIRRSGGRNAPFDRHFGGARLSRKSRRIPVPERHHHLPLSPLLPSSNYSTILIRSPFLFPSRVDNQAGEFPRIATTFRVPCSSLDRRPKLDEIGIREDGSKGRGERGKYFGRGKNWKKPAARSLIDISIEFR